MFYGSSHVINVPQHGLSGFTNVYANGVWPHYEFRNTWMTNAYVLISDVVCQEKVSCGPP